MNTQDATPDLVDVAVHGEKRAEAGKMDSFPEEGTDEKIVKPGAAAEKPLSEAEALKATETAIRAEAHGGGDARDIAPPDTHSGPPTATPQVRVSDSAVQLDSDGTLSLHDDDADLLDEDRSSPT